MDPWGERAVKGERISDAHATFKGAAHRPLTFLSRLAISPICKIGVGRTLPFKVIQLGGGGGGCITKESNR